MSRSREIFYISKDFSGTDICHSDIKNALLQISFFFCLRKIIFQNSQNFLKQNLVRSKFFPQGVEKIEKLKRSLSKQHHKMLKTTSEMLKTRKKAKQ